MILATKTFEFDFLKCENALKKLKEPSKKDKSKHHKNRIARSFTGFIDPNVYVVCFKHSKSVKVEKDFVSIQLAKTLVRKVCGVEQGHSLLQNIGSCDFSGELQDVSRSKS